MELWIATTNKGKVREFNLLLQSFTLRFLKEVPAYQAPEETGSSFQENARIKARSFKYFLDQQRYLLANKKYLVIGEDSGLNVPALAMRPGIYSARYSGKGATDESNVRKLMQEMSRLPKVKRGAYLTSHIVAISWRGKEFSCEGVLEGHIVDTYNETNSTMSKQESNTWPENWPRFGYDPVFIPAGKKKSFFELGLQFKNSCSHRYLAVQKLKQLLKNQ